jgi:hypothetical protein
MRERRVVSAIFATRFYNRIGFLADLGVTALGLGRPEEVLDDFRRTG